MASGAVRRPLLAPGVVPLLVLAGAAWAALTQLRGGAMGAPAQFVPAWVLMMAAMMLPAVAPVAALYAATLRRRRAARLLAFAGGYLAVWAATAGPAYALSTLVDDGVAPHPLARRLTAAAIFACCGVYQLTPLKERCLRHCRSPLAQLLRYASFTGRARDLRVGAFHAAYCLGCCWALMLLLVAFGTMSLGAALALAALVAAEKLTPWGPAVARLAGWAALALAVTALVVPGVAPGLAPSDMAPMTGG